ncbi:type I methionyl aminopeptidase [Egicoccus sp. AB-alg2]|uniref:type I methionyl aminopeptidase n=1 Tax=Egicoccus sp. AB-alg2 TaxID=3242693 RepID=UPI00359EC13D
MIIRKSRKDIAGLREAGRVVALAHRAMRAAADVGVTLRDLDEVARDVLREHGATSAFLDYHPHFAPTPFPGVICASKNDVIVHGIPNDDPLKDGDLLSIDFGAILDGWVGDAAVTFSVGTVRPEDEHLRQAAEDALAAGIAAAAPGARLGDIGAAIGAIGRGHGYGIPQGWGGHGVGRAMHEEPSVPNEGQPGRGLRLRPGLVIAIEPMFMAGGRDDYRIDDDGWTIRTVDGSRASHAEHTIAITDDGPQILTLP